MDAVLRSAAIYLFLLVLFRLAGRRALAEMTAFDLVLLLIISEATQQALLGDDFSVANALIVITALIAIDIILGVLKGRWSFLAKLADGAPMVIVENGRCLDRRMNKARIGVDDVMHAARDKHGVERLEDIKFAVLEISGGISIIPRKDAG